MGRTSGKNRVGIVMPIGESRGGAEMMLLNLLSANRMLAVPVDYHVCLLQDGPMARTIRDWGYPVQVLPSKRVRNAAAFASVIWGLRNWLISNRIDSALAWMSKSQLYLAPAAVLARVPNAWFQHELPGARIHRIASFLPARLVLACSQCVATQQRGLTPNTPIEVVNPSVDLSRFNTSVLPDVREARARLGLPEKGPIIGIIARLQRWKGVHVLLSSAPHILTKYPSAHFLVVGGEHFDEAEYLLELAQQVASAGLADHVTMAGHQTDVPLWTQALDVAVVASETEPFGMSAIEAMALGKLLAAYKAGGFLESVEDEISGKFFETRDGESLAEAVDWLLCDTERASYIAERARDRAHVFSSSVLAQRVALLMGQLSGPATVNLPKLSS